LALAIALSTLALTASAGGAAGVTTSGLNPAQVATLRWYDSGTTFASFAVGTTPKGIAFDGTSLWVANSGSNNVTKLDPATGSVLHTTPVGTSPSALAFDGTRIWVANSGSNTVTRVNAATGTATGTFAVGTNPSALAFDGTNIWVANSGSDNVTKLDS